eukprot:3111078-Pyramimonas_sp.AAC.1
MEGRLGAVRCRGKVIDMTFVVGYAPTEPHGSAKERCVQEKKCKQFWKSLNSLVDTFPARTIPIFMIDANAKLGGKQESRYVGTCEPDDENFNGSRMRDFLEQQELAALNTFFETGPTFYHGSGLH